MRGELPGHTNAARHPKQPGGFSLVTRKFYERAAEIHSRTGDPYEEITSRVNYAQLLWEPEQPSEARAALRKAIELDRTCGNPGLDDLLKQLEYWTRALGWPQLTRPSKVPTSI
jgi:Tetratricopeptide repeat